MKKRYGKFVLPRLLIDKYPEDAQKIFSKCIPTRAEYMMHNDTVHYTALSDLFDEVSQGDEIPEYQFEVDGGVVMVLHGQD